MFLFLFFFFFFCRKDPYPDLRPVQVATLVAQQVNPLRLPTPSRMHPNFTALFLRCIETNEADRPNFDVITEELEKMDTLFVEE